LVVLTDLLAKVLLLDFEQGFRILASSPEMKRLKITGKGRKSLTSRR